VLHLHGEIMRARSTVDSGSTRPFGDTDIHLGDTCHRGGQLRPHVVWFGEMVPAMDEAEAIAPRAAGA
jgi:NAD-dependent deacetylase